MVWNKLFVPLGLVSIEIVIVCPRRRGRRLGGALIEHNGVRWWRSRTFELWPPSPPLDIHRHREYDEVNKKSDENKTNDGTHRRRCVRATLFSEEQSHCHRCVRIRRRENLSRQTKTSNVLLCLTHTLHQWLPIVGREDDSVCVDDKWDVHRHVCVCVRNIVYIIPTNLSTPSPSINWLTSSAVLFRPHKEQNNKCANVIYSRLSNR